MLFIIVSIILSMINAPLATTNDYIDIKTAQSETEAHIVSTEKTIYDLTFSAACVHSVVPIEQFFRWLEEYGISDYDVINDGADTVVIFSDELSLNIKDVNMSDTYISISINDKHLNIPIECSFMSEEEQISLLTRDFSSYDFSSVDIRSIIDQAWKNDLDDGLLKGDELVGSLYQIYLQATSVYPWMSYAECMDMLQSASSDFGFISNTESEIWVYHALPKTEMELHFSYYFDCGRLTCMTVTLFPPNNASFAVELEQNKYIAPMIFIRIEDTWLTHYLENC